MTPSTWATLGLLLLILAGIAVGRYPRLRMNRATIALVGATALVLFGAIPLDAAYASIDMNTIVLLLAMMVLNANLRLAGFFQLVTGRILRYASTPRQLLALLIGAAGLLSALFLNDTIVLMFTPLVVSLTLALRRNPLPYLIALATAANIGSVATITGNPQNMLIGTSSGISYLRFAAYLTPVALVGLLFVWLVMVWLYPAEFGRERLELPPPERFRLYRPLLRKSLLATGLMLIGFLAGLPVALAALGAAALLLITRRLRPERVFGEIDWALLVFFAGLFVITGAIESSGLSERLFAWLTPLVGGGIGPLTLVAMLLSNLISNVPAVMLFRPVVPALSDPVTVWLTLAMATTLAGNLTLLGSVANLIVAESAAARGIRLSFGTYLRAGVPITLLSLAWGVAWLELVR
ncbi:MAG: anion transporter [Anaerolineales bacterium]|nr:anion transporter [Anaerolineales bacterium]MCB0011287.1 anion transporter [Anaerolineales bacterium]MCB8959814.1 anion transporter [Ardenticatenales bacterium]